MRKDNDPENFGGEKFGRPETVDIFVKKKKMHRATAADCLTIPLITVKLSNCQNRYNLHYY